MNKLIMMIGAAAVAVGANADTWTDPDTEIVWTYSQKNDTEKKITLGDGTQSTEAACRAMATATVLDAANIPWTMDINNDGEPYTVTALAPFAFASCSELTGTLAIPNSVTNVRYRAFQKTGISAVSSIGGITTLSDYVFNESGSLASFTADISDVTSIGKGAFQNTKLKGGFYVSGSTTVTTERLFQNNSLDVIFFGSNTTGASVNPTTKMLNGVTGCKVFVPVKSSWSGLNVGGTGNEIIWYGATTNLNLAVDDAHGVITATPTDEAALVKVLESAPLFKTNFGWNTRINVTNTIEVSAGTITAEMLNAVEFNTMLLTFKVNTQAALDSVLAAVPASTYPLLAIDASDAREELILPQGREVYVRVSGDGKQGRYRPKVNGLIISFF